MRTHRHLAVLAATGLLTAAAAGTASAAPSDWTCKGTAVRVLATEIGIANPAANPCSEAGTALFNDAAIKAAHAETTMFGTYYGLGVGANAAIASADITVAGVRITAREIASQATSRCQYGYEVISTTHHGSSSIETLAINGTPVTGGALDAPRVITVTPTTKVRINQTVSGAGQITQRAIEVVVLGTSVAVLGEARTGLTRCSTLGGGPNDTAVPPVDLPDLPTREMELYLPGELNLPGSPPELTRRPPSTGAGADRAITTPALAAKSAL